MELLKRKKLAVLAVIIIAVAFALFGIKRESRAKTEQQTTRPALTVTIELPDTRNWPQRISSTGNVQAWQEAVIGSEVSGLRLAELNVNVGDMVRKGQVLARFNDDTVALDLEQQQAALEEAKARYEQVQAKAESSAKLREAGMISNLENIQNQTNAQIAKAQMQAAEARAKLQKLKLDYTKVRAPDDGIISSRTATVGAVIQTGNEMFRYIRRNQVEWRAEVPEATLPSIRVGQKVRLRTALGDDIDGRVSRISPVVDTQSRNGSVFVELNAINRLRPGMFAQGDFELGHSKALTVAQNAVVIRDGYSYVFRVGDDDHVTQVKVKTGRQQDGRIEIEEGLDARVRVVTAGAGFLSEGDLVRVADADAGKKTVR